MLAVLDICGCTKAALNIQLASKTAIFGLNWSFKSGFKFLEFENVTHPISKDKTSRKG